MNREAGRGGRRDRHEGRQQGGGRRDGGHGRGRDGQGRQRSGSRGQGGPRRGWSSSRPSERSRRTTSSRQVAFEGLRTVREDDAYANLVLSGLLRRHRVSGRDAAFTTELFYGSLRAQGRLDAIIAACVDRDLRSEEHTSELQSRGHLVCRLLLEKKKGTMTQRSMSQRE